MALRWPNKDPNDVADYVIDWHAGANGELGQLQLDGDTIATSTWIVPSGITKDSDSNTSTTTTIWLSGGTAGEEYEIVNRITTSGGRTWDQTVEIKVRSR